MINRRGHKEIKRISQRKQEYKRKYYEIQEHTKHTAHTHKIFPLSVSSELRPNPQFFADLVTFTEQIFHEKLFLISDDTCLCFFLL